MKKILIVSTLLFTAAISLTSLAVGQSGKQNGIAGVYMGVPANFTFVTPYTSTGLVQQSGKDFFVLFPNGQLRRNLPQGGLDHFDIAKDKATTPGNWGTYKVTSSRILIDWQTAKGDFFAERANGGFRYQSDPYVLMPESDNARIEGTYKREDGMNPSARITFQRNGTFHETGLIGPYIALNNYKIPGSGTYHVSDHSLYLDYSDGRHRKISYLTLPTDAGKSQPAKILLNTYDLSRNAKTDSYTATPAGPVLAKGDPPLTKQMAEDATDYYEWFVEADFTPEQRAQVMKYIVAYWTTNSMTEIKNVIDVLRAKERLAKEPEYVRNSTRSYDQRIILDLWRKTTDDPLSIYLAQIYDAAHNG